MVHLSAITGRKGCQLNKNKIIFWGLLVLIFLLFPVQYELAEAYDGTTTVFSNPNLVIPDGVGAYECGDEVEDIVYIFGLPEEAVVLWVDVSFTISFPFLSELVVILQYGDDPNKIEILWNMDGEDSPYTKNDIWSFYGLKANTHWKLKLRDCFFGYSGAKLVSWSLTVHYHVPPDPPIFVWAYAGSGPREIDLSWAQVFDEQCSGYRIEGNRNRDTLENYNVYEVLSSVYDCNTTFKTIDNVACVDSYYFQIRTISSWASTFFGRPSRPLAEGLSSYCDSFRVRGSLNYVNYDDKYAEYTYDADTIPLPNALVTIWESVTGDSLPIPPIYTITLGGIIDTLLYYYVNYPIYMRFQLVDQNESLKVKDYDNDAVIFTYSDTLGPDNFFRVIRDEFSLDEQDLRFARASYSFNYIQKTKKRFEVEASWITPPILVAYDYDNLTGLSFSWYDSLRQDYWVVLTSLGEPFFGYRLGTPTHEFAHLIHINAWEVNSVGSGCPPIHALDTPTSGYCALVEGWAEFISCIFRGDRAKYLKHSQQNLEYNDWWAGTDGTNENGSFVEGAVASAWYDMEDWDVDKPDECSDTDYFELVYEFDNIFNIFRILKPQDMVEFMNYYQNYPGIEQWQKDNLVRIFKQHYIFKPGDANTDGKVSVSDIVFLINYLFKFGPAPNPLWVGDANGDCKVSVSDTVYLISYIFKQGAEPIYNPDC